MKQKKDEKQVKIKPIIKELIEGQCFICNTKCESYVHPDCAIAYTDYKEYLVMLEQEKKDERYEKIVQTIINKRKKSARPKVVRSVSTND